MALWNHHQTEFQPPREQPPRTMPCDQEPEFNKPRANNALKHCLALLKACTNDHEINDILALSCADSEAVTRRVCIREVGAFRSTRTHFANGQSLMDNVNNARQKREVSSPPPETLHRPEASREPHPPERLHKPGSAREHEGNHDDLLNMASWDDLLTVAKQEDVFGGLDQTEFHRQTSHE
eukprot:CAMPEP_0181321832 /NCGR_PEP_ID=MMETSP1101-20121128/18905_1 /TAXON_ID=46948 /ORGANISM="Rhodomonas abbreviata, Strain Caron Lab Isolate" /LENGTH=180 /DNA_ID=CAMNT_0023429705 /DNA_START=81 /DNA_END=623 /DNA_ORIENTATION=-